jgi:hypothetical protein
LGSQTECKNSNEEAGEVQVEQGEFSLEHGVVLNG